MFRLAQQIAGNPWETGLAYVDGEVVDLKDARIPLVETGFMRSDVTYDVVAVWGGRFFRLDDHLERFAGACAKLRMTPPLDSGELGDVLGSLVGRAGFQDAYVAMISTRGVPPGRTRDPRLFKGRLYAFTMPYIWVFTPEQQDRGVRAIVSSVERQSPKAFDPSIKNFEWGDLTRAAYEAYDRDAETGILLDGDGYVTEGPGFNVLAIVDGVLRTPIQGALLGITRRTVLELAQETGMPTRPGPLHVDELRAAEEIFFATTAGGVMPAGTLDGEPIGSGGGRPGPKSLELRRLYWEAHSRPEWTTEVDYERAAVGAGALVGASQDIPTAE